MFSLGAKEKTHALKRLAESALYTEEFGGKEKILESN
jgi:hypothetical protein